MNNELFAQYTEALINERCTADELTDAEQAYNEALKPLVELLKTQQPELVTKLVQAEQNYQSAKQRVKELEAQTRAALTTAEKLDGLPEGFTQTEHKEINITDALALREWVKENMPALLVVDTVSLQAQALKTLNKDKATGKYTLAASLNGSPLEVMVSYKPRISTKTILGE